MNRLAFVVAVLAVGCGYENSQLRLRSAVDAQQSQLNACYEQSLATNGDVSGMMKVIMHVSRNAGGQGAIEDARITANELADPDLQQCVRAALVGVSIGAAPINDNLDVEYTIAFRPE